MIRLYDSENPMKIAGARPGNFLYDYIYGMAAQMQLFRNSGGAPATPRLRPQGEP